MDISDKGLSSGLPEKCGLPLSSRFDGCENSTSFKHQKVTEGQSATSSNTVQEKVQNLPLLCVEAICEVTPTSKLARLCSISVPLPRASWSFGLEAVLENRRICYFGLEAVLKKRLPLSLAYDPPYHPAAVLAYYPAAEPAPHAVFDAAGAKIASVKHPEALRSSPLCERIESATFALRVIPTTPGEQELYAVYGSAVLSWLPNITDLTLVLHADAGRTFDANCREQRDSLGLSLSHLLPRLQSLAFICASSPLDSALSAAIAAFLRHQLSVQEMPKLARLFLPEVAFRGVMEAVSDCGRPVLAALDSLGIWQHRTYELDIDPEDVAARLEMLQFVSTHYAAQLSALFVRVDGVFKAYLPAFRALTGLTTLGLHVHWTELRGLRSSESTVVTSVLDLRFLYTPCDSSRAAVLAIASLFPNAKAVAFQADSEIIFPLDLVFEFCAKRVLPAVQQLSCFDLARGTLAVSDLLVRFVGNPNLPEAVDLSQAAGMKFLSHQRETLTAVYCAMQRNATRRLLLRGPLHREALPRLKRHLERNVEDAKISAWKDRDLGDQPEHPLAEMASETEVSIVGRKIFGPLAGEQFTIRVFHQLTPQRHIFD